MVNLINYFSADTLTSNNIPFGVMSGDLSFIADRPVIYWPIG